MPMPLTRKRVMSTKAVKPAVLPPNFSVDTSVPPPSIPALEFSKSP